MTPRVLAFDVFGTVVDWHGSIARAVAPYGVDGAAFARAWRAGYAPAMDRVRRGDLPWTLLDDLHRMVLDGVLADFGLSLTDVTTEELNRTWHRLDPWPDAVAGIRRLRTRFRVVTLSNGNLRLLEDLSRSAGLEWDEVLCAETFRAYKPDPAVYEGAARRYGLEPGEVVMVATHRGDLEAARAAGLRTAYVERPAEHGTDRRKPAEPSAADLVHARDLVDLAEQLGC